MHVPHHEEHSFLSWMRKSNNFFTGNEYHFRFGVFLANQRYVQEHNKKGGFTLALNKFAAYTPAEYQSIVPNSISFVDYDDEKEPNNLVDAPPTDDWDWRDHAYTGTPFDVGNCHCEWALTTIQTLQSFAYIQEGGICNISPQSLIDCVDTCQGCEGGSVFNALQYIHDNMGCLVPFETDYPYMGYKRACAFNIEKGGCIYRIESIVSIKAGSEEGLKEAVHANGPVPATIDASPISFQLYNSGIYSDSKCSSKKVSFPVGVVGYGHQDATKYWICRNNWGDDWGEEGYIRIIKDKKNMCGIATKAYYPLLNITRNEGFCNVANS